MMARIEQVLAGEKSWGKYALDVFGHLGLGTLYALPTTVAGVYLGAAAPLILSVGVIIALVGGVCREIAQYMGSRKAHFLDRSLDALHHILGAPVAFGIAVGVKALL
jgi:hypothetical protein